MFQSKLHYIEYNLLIKTKSKEAMFVSLQWSFPIFSPFLQEAKLEMDEKNDWRIFSKLSRQKWWNCECSVIVLRLSMYVYLTGLSMFSQRKKVHPLYIIITIILQEYYLSILFNTNFLGKDYSFCLVRIYKKVH